MGQWSRVTLRTQCDDELTSTFISIINIILITTSDVDHVVDAPLFYDAPD